MNSNAAENLQGLTDRVAEQLKTNFGFIWLRSVASACRRSAADECRPWHFSLRAVGLPSELDLRCICVDHGVSFEGFGRRRSAADAVQR